jgi:hypothetical protein
MKRAFRVFSLDPQGVRHYCGTPQIDGAGQCVDADVTTDVDEAYHIPLDDAVRIAAFLSHNLYWTFSIETTDGSPVTDEERASAQEHARALYGRDITVARGASDADNAARNQQLATLRDLARQLAALAADAQQRSSSPARTDNTANPETN